MNAYKTLTIFALTALFSAGAMAAGNSIRDTHSFRLGIYSQDAEITAQSTVDPFPPIEIDLSDDLNLDDSSESIYFSYRWRFKEKWSLNAAFQTLDLNGDAAAGFDFNFDGKPFTAGAAIETQFDLDTYYIDVAYSLVRNDRWEVLFGAGIHAFDFDIKITSTIGIASGAGGEEIFESITASADVLAHAPICVPGRLF